jgi:hypothetical protein
MTRNLTQGIDDRLPDRSGWPTSQGAHLVGVGIRATRSVWIGQNAHMISSRELGPSTTKPLDRNQYALSPISAPRFFTSPNQFAVTVDALGWAADLSSANEH